MEESGGAEESEDMSVERGEGSGGGAPCVSCGELLAADSNAARHVHERPEGGSVSVQHSLAVAAGLLRETGSVCQRCFQLVARLQLAELRWRQLREQLVAVCTGSSLSLNLHKQTQTDVEVFVPATSPVSVPVTDPGVPDSAMVIKTECYDDVPLSPAHFSDSDDEPLYKTKLNALLDNSQFPNGVDEVKTESSSNMNDYSCRECSSVFSDKSRAAIHAFSVHRIDPALDPDVITSCNSSIESKRSKGQRKSHRRSITDDDFVLSKKTKSKKSESRHLKKPVRSKATSETNIKPIKTITQLKQKLSISDLTIKKVPYSSILFAAESSACESKKDKLTVSGSVNSNAILSQLQTAGLQVTSNIKTEEKKKKRKELLRCTECYASFNTQARLDFHMVKHEESKSPFICEICGASYKHKKACDIHVGMHKGISPWKCAECGKIFPSKGALSRHEAIHTGTPNYQCDLCGKSFIHTSSFKMHKLSHSGVKPHTCSKCGLSLMTRSHLKRHQRVHSGEKRHECQTCGKKFSERYNLYAHQKSHDYSSVHRQMKSHNCTLCDSTFIRRHLLDKHMEAVHQLVSETKQKQSRNTMNKLLKNQQTQGMPVDASMVKPEVILTEVIVDPPTISPPLNQTTVVNSTSNMKAEVSFTSTSIKVDESASQSRISDESVNGTHPWQGLVNYQLANDYPLRMHGVDYVGYLNRQ
ncbi:uncharacterized protein LOC143916895 [Arctopsyche grandis]|uniref:uncharacterized protein LOC143916895 n=1 Tax=Arctopsyche grandis TaxID=121162 RepID=UPI00406D9D2E